MPVSPGFGEDRDATPAWGERPAFLSQDVRTGHRNHQRDPRKPPARRASAGHGLSEATISVGVPLPGSQCGVGNGRTIAWTAHAMSFRLAIGH